MFTCEDSPRISRWMSAKWPTTSCPRILHSEQRMTVPYSCRGSLGRLITDQPKNFSIFTPTLHSSRVSLEVTHFSKTPPFPIPRFPVLVQERVAPIINPDDYPSLIVDTSTTPPEGSTEIVYSAVDLAWRIRCPLLQAKAQILSKFVSGQQMLAMLAVHERQRSFVFRDTP